MERCVIVGGAKIFNYDFVKSFLRPNDFMIYCDGGLSHFEKLNLKPSLIIGDFDSHEKPQSSVETIVLPTEKDDTDTVAAVRVALQRGFREFLLIGVIGGRFDHSLGNLSILLMLHEKDCDAMIVDDYSTMQIVAKQPVFVDDACKFFSLLNICGTARGINIKNAKYPLENATISCTYQYGVSNEVEKNQVAEISVEEGNLLLVRVYANELNASHSN